MPTRKRITESLATLFVAVLLLAGCGGGGESAEAEAPPATGVWTGVTSAGRAVQGVVLSDGRYYLVYSAAVNPQASGGLLQGAGSVQDANFIAEDGLDFSMEGVGVTASPLEAPVPTLVLRGRVRPTTPGEIRFRMTRTPDSFTRPTLSGLAGTYPGQVAFSLGSRSATFSVTASGQVSTVINGCSITGTAQPRNDVNAYDLSMTFGGAPCVFPFAQFTGVAYLAASGKLHAAVLNAPSSQAIVFAGARQ
jgi:hypothetical protein